MPVENSLSNLAMSRYERQKKQNKRRGVADAKYPQSPPNYREYLLIARATLLFAMRGGYKLFGLLNEGV
jgi:hypothetical protein